MEKAHELIKSISFDKFIVDHFFPLLKKFEEMESNFKKEQEGIKNLPKNQFFYTY